MREDCEQRLPPVQVCPGFATSRAYLARSLRASYKHFYTLPSPSPRTILENSADKNKKSNVALWNVFWRTLQLWNVFWRQDKSRLNWPTATPRGEREKER